MKRWDVIIIGAGGAGMMCAAQAATRGRKVLLIDHAQTIGAKILISGGGRCNFTNTEACAERYVSQNPHFCRSALARYTAADFIALVEKHGIAYHEKKLGQLFCDGSAQQIVDMLMKECADAGVALHLGTTVDAIFKKGMVFHLKTSRGEFEAASLVIATGGLSIPKTGATSFGHRIAGQFDLQIVPPSPALDGFVFDADLLQQLGGLSGVSLDVVLTCNKVSFRENILFTHRGLSGPAALQASLYWNSGDPLSINLLPDVDVPRWFAAKREGGSHAEIRNLLLEFFPKSFAECFCRVHLSESKPLQQVSIRTVNALAKVLIDWKIIPAGTVGFGRAEVTRGGLSTDELSSKTMEAKKVPGLYFIGEVVDVTGWLGGYNFQWAWASGFVAGQAL